MASSPGHASELPFVGRAHELALLEGLVTAPAPSVVLVRGIGGIGKSRLLEELAQRMRAAGTSVIRIDCTAIEPTQGAFCRELGRAAGCEISTIEELADRLSELGQLVLVLDEVDALRLLEAWLRSTFIHALPHNVHFIFSGRNPALVPWLQTRSQRIVRILELSTLDPASALALLASAGINPVQAARINRVAHGYPIALTIAASMLSPLDAGDFENVAFAHIIDELARRYLSDVEDPVTRRALEAASVARAVTVPLLGSMLEDVAPADAYERLRVLPLMRLTPAGLMLHDAVRDAFATALRASNPQRHLELRRRCWYRITQDLRTAPASEMWRHTADLLFLLENPSVREAFFPSVAPEFTIEPATSADAASILAIAQRHEEDEGAHAIASWWSAVPAAFSVARAHDGSVAGFYIAADDERIPKSLRNDDPILARWMDDAASAGLGENERVLFIRRWLSMLDGESPGTVQAACWLDIKRSYMTMRPHLRRVYLTLRALTPYAAAATTLGFEILDRCTVAVGSQPYYTAALDFGPKSVDGWFERLVADELGLATPNLLDLASREMVVGESRSALTPREFETLRVLVEHSGQVVNRDAILESVWGAQSDVVSNVVDVVVRSLRRKLGEKSAAIETVAKVGYRLRNEHFSEEPESPSLRSRAR